MTMNTVDQQQKIDAVNQTLPQTQCQQCGFQGCLPYAEALVAKTTAINRCPPGGDAVIRRLSALLQTPILPLDNSCGDYQLPQTVEIIEVWCIGCTKCIQVCPVDAIVGARKLMHTVIEADCTGCELCIPVCPVDCIQIQPVENYRSIEGQMGLDQWMQARADHARALWERRQKRISTQVRVTETVLPQTVSLAERTDVGTMQDLIAKAKALTQQKYHPTSQK